MRLTILTCGIAVVLSTTVLADMISEPTASMTSDNYRAEITPFPQHPEGELVDDAHLEIRQVLEANPNAEQAPGQVPPVTIYTIATQIGATGVVTQVTYTQLFSPVPDQWPSPKSGVIGLGGAAKEKRGLETVDVVEVEQPVVMVIETEVVTVALQRVTEVMVVENLIISEFVPAGNGTAFAGNGSSLASPFAASAGFRPEITTTFSSVPTGARQRPLDTAVPAAVASGRRVWR